MLILDDLRRSTRAICFATILMGLTLADFATAAVDPRYTYDGGSCTRRVDPLNVLFLNVSVLGAQAEFDALFRWRHVPGSFQSAFSYAGNCVGTTDHIGREFGKPSSSAYPVDGYKTSEKVHIRLFEVGTGQVAGDAHREHKGDCTDKSKDAVLGRYNGTPSGFDGTMKHIVNTYRRKASAGHDISVARARGPFKNAFRQCNGKWVTWSGDVAYIRRTGS